MATMYELIMDLPLFKGVGKDHVSSFLEKTNVNFINYGCGEKVVSKGEAVSMVKFVISGEVLASHVLERCGLVVEECCGYGRVIGADRLYGMTTGYSCDVTALTRTSIMEFRKDQYVKLLNSDPIYLLNFFNFLSSRAQKPVDAVTEFAGGDVGARFCFLLKVLTDPESTGIRIKGSLEDMAKCFSTDVSSVARWMDKVERKELVEYSDGIMKIKNRAEFLFESGE